MVLLNPKTRVLPSSKATVIQVFGCSINYTQSFAVQTLGILAHTCPVEVPKIPLWSRKTNLYVLNILKI